MTAIEGGKVDVNGERAKRARPLRPGDMLRIRLGPYEHLVQVVALSHRRGPASEAAKLFLEDEAARRQRLDLAAAHKLANQAFAHGDSKPSRREREATRRLRGKT